MNCNTTDTRDRNFNNDYLNGLWARKLCDSASMEDRIHPKRLHYFAVMQQGITLPEGKPYTNTANNYSYLLKALDSARLQCILPYEGFYDYNRFPSYINDRHILANTSIHQKISVLTADIEKACRRYIRQLISHNAPAHVEIWLEQTNAHDIIDSIADKYNLNIVHSFTDISMTEIWKFAKRISGCKKPVRIFYLSDLITNKPGKTSAIERAISVLGQYGLTDKIDFKIEKLALKKEDAARFSLPEIPCINHDRRARQSSRIELDSLEAVAPNHLGNLVEKQVSRYLSPTEKSSIGDVMDRLLHEISHQFSNIFQQKLHVFVNF